MPLSTIDPKTALVVIDLQQGIVDAPTVHPVGEVGEIVERSAVSTTSGVESTARSAYDHGYHVVLATDAMTDTDPDAHATSVERIFPKLGETATTAEILTMLETR